MASDESIHSNLLAILKRHKDDGTLLAQTPRTLREELAQVMQVEIGEIDSRRNEIKVWIQSFAENQGLRTVARAPSKAMDPAPLQKASIRRKETNMTSSSSGATSDSGSSDSVNGSETHTVTQLRSIAKLLGVPPSFWSNLDKDSEADVKSRLSEFCVSKNVQVLGEVPTIKEALKYKQQRDALVELEGINSSNIVSGKRKRFVDLPF